LESENQKVGITVTSTTTIDEPPGKKFFLFRIVGCDDDGKIIFGYIVI
jgi:hypothetical protein